MANNKIRYSASEPKYDYIYCEPCTEMGYFDVSRIGIGIPPQLPVENDSEQFSYLIIKPKDKLDEILENINKIIDSFGLHYKIKHKYKQYALSLINNDRKDTLMLKLNNLSNHEHPYSGVKFKIYNLNFDPSLYVTYETITGSIENTYLDMLDDRDKDEKIAKSYMSPKCDIGGYHKEERKITESEFEEFMRKREEETNYINHIHDKDVDLKEPDII